MSSRKRSRMAKPLGYAKRLSPYSHKGQCGDEVPEETEPLHDLNQKIDLVVDAIKRASYLVAHTGAGISTAAGIPDFRGKTGIWTKEKQGQPLPDHEACWSNAVPTLGHMALVGLKQAGLLKYIISQNIDGLHLRSGIPRDALSELHGNMFMERCSSCSYEVLRSFDVGGIAFKPTGRACPMKECGSRMIDHLLDWEDDLPQPDFARARQEAAKCGPKWAEDDENNEAEGDGGLALCLGTSMQMTPARDLACEAGRLVIVNLQKTQKDYKAWMVLRGKIDNVMYGIMKKLELRIPVYERFETLAISHEMTNKHTSSQTNGTCNLTSILRIKVGEACPFSDGTSGFISSVTFVIKNGESGPSNGGGDEEKEGGGRALGGGGGGEEEEKVIDLTHQPFSHVEQFHMTRSSSSCPLCCTTATAEESSSLSTIKVTITIHFESIPSITADASIRPSHTPPPWTKAYEVEDPSSSLLSQQQAGKKKLTHTSSSSAAEEVTVRLVRVDYNELYSPPIPPSS